MNKTKRIIISSGIAFILVGAIFMVARSGESNTAPAGAVSTGVAQALAIVGNPYDIGSGSMARGNVSYDFQVMNNGVEPVTIRKMYTSCMCTTARLTTREGTIGPVGMPGHGFVPSINRTIAPGETATVAVTFDPAAHGPAGIGRVDRVVYLERDAGEPVELTFSATVTP
ncbi:MAG: DUF1573 domain-containing protein [Patescibacteria group bacterium]